MSRRARGLWAFLKRRKKCEHHELLLFIRSACLIANQTGDLKMGIYKIQTAVEDALNG